MPCGYSKLPRQRSLQARKSELKVTPVIWEAEILCGNRRSLWTLSAIPQAWARAIQAHPTGVHGLLYTSRFTRKRCLALFSPPTDRASISADGSSPLPENSEALEFLAENKVALV